MSEHLSTCAGCGAPLSPAKACLDYRDDLFFYTLSLRDPEFLHQYAVDAYTAQHIGDDTKPVAIAGSLIGLCLFAERQYTGREVQKVHMILGNKMKEWPKLSPPLERATLTVVDVLNAPPGPERDQAIRNWARSVWEMWKQQHGEIDGLVRNSYSSAQ